jgi:hypothetical protein
VEEGQAQGRLDRRRPEVALDPVEDREEADELAIGVQAEDGPDEPVAAVGDREAIAQAPPGRRTADLPA